VLNPDLKQPSTWEATTSFERELMPSLAFRTMYIYRRQDGYFTSINTLRPYDVYNSPITQRDPGPDGTLNTGDDGSNVTFYDYDSAYRGATFVNSKTVNNTNMDTYHSIEWTVTKRSTSRWMAQASYFLVKNHQWQKGVVETPNDLFFPTDNTWTWAGNANGSYRFNYDITVSGFLQSQSGLKGARTVQFQGIPNLNTLTLRLEEPGTQRLAALNILNLRASKNFTFHGGKRIGADFDLFNVLNVATPTSAVFQSGPTYGYVTGVVPGRIARLGARFNF